MIGAPQMAPQPAMQGGWIDQHAWEAQFIQHNSQPIDQQAIQAAIANNSTMMQSAPINNGMMAMAMPQEAAAQSDAYMTVPMQTDPAPSKGYAQQLMASAAMAPQPGPAYAYEDQAQAQQYAHEDAQPQQEEDPFLEAMLRQAQAGIFVLPNKEPESTPV
jgi:hypothetical protein